MTCQMIENQFRQLSFEESLPTEDPPLLDPDVYVHLVEVS